MRLCIDAGHGGRDSGAVGGGVKESDLALEHAFALRRHAKDAGIQTHMTRVSDMSLTLAHRCLIANDWKATVFVSLHCNADADPDESGMKEARGFEVLYYPASERSRLLALRVGLEFEKEYSNVPNRGAHERDDLFVLRRTHMPAILVELGFIDSQEDRARLQSRPHQEKMAALLLRALRPTS